MSHRQTYINEYRKYLRTYEKCPLIMPSFITYLRDKRDEAGIRKNWKAYEYWSELIQLDIEEENDYLTSAEEEQGSDADPGL